ncbi:MAG: T9SS type A sorting domain-containing protein, partial [Candidatus Cloacimonadota bacterium]|nr:T9SS type A sorting domain-containing protein [Candidatus Cloacimonadota bacterium]
ELSAFMGEYINVPTLYWVTQSETDNLGWYVYRSTENSFATADKIPNLIDGYGSTSEPHSYIYEDKMVETMPGDAYWYWIESVDLGGEVHHFNSVKIEIPDGSEHPSITKPVIYALQNSPNPFRGSTEIRFTLSEPALAEVTIYNILGEKVRTLPPVVASEDTEASAYWDGRDESGEEVVSGIYFYILKAGKSAYSGKMILLK